MGRYATVDEVNALVVGVGSASNPTSATRESWIGQVEGEVNAKLSDKYTVPFTDIPPIIKTITQDMTQYMIQRSIHTADHPTVSDWTERFLDARALLDSIAKGETSLVNSAGTVVSAITTQKGVESTDSEDFKPVFDVRDPLSWRIDPDRIDALDSEDT